MNVAKNIRRLTLLLSIVLLIGAILVLLIRQLQPLIQVISGGQGLEAQLPITTPASRPTATPSTVAAQISNATAMPRASATRPQLDQLLQRTLQAPQLPLSSTQSMALATSTMTATRSVTTTQLTAIVNVDLANLREGPGTAYAVVGQLRLQERVALIARNDASDWWQLCCLEENTESTNTAVPRWISAALVELEANATSRQQQLPIATAAAVPTAQAVAAAASGSGSGAGPGLPPSGTFSPPSGLNGLTGLPLPGQRAGARPLIVCVNNDPAARPQFGLSQADIVYEYLMEGYGITRFSAIFYGEEVGQIGPVRSARLINYYMGALYDAGLICSGASDRVRYSLKHEAPFPYLDIDLDDPANSRYSVSIGSDYRTRLRTSTTGGRRWLADWGMERAPQLRALTFGAISSSGSAAATVNIPYPYGSTVSYSYDGGSGRYLRNLAGTAHVDGNTGSQVAVENVMVQFVPHEATDIVEDSLGSTSIRLNLFGSGRALLFRDGQAFAGTWRSESRGDLPRFYNESGQELALKPGKSWISIVPATYTIGYQ